MLVIGPVNRGIETHPRIKLNLSRSSRCSHVRDLLIQLNRIRFGSI